jgi:predicted O-methyltransferase YrrM
LINFSQAAENNKTPILEQLNTHLRLDQTVLEVGSGSGQHALHFASQLPHITWQPSDQGEYFEGLMANIKQSGLGNVREPIYLDLNEPVWPANIDCVYAANVVHIMPASLLPALFQNPADTLLLYGPYKYGGAFTSESNADFDLWLKARNSHSGIRDIETLLELAEANHYQQTSDTAMPANNQFLVFKRRS